MDINQLLNGELPTLEEFVDFCGVCENHLENSF